MGIYQEGRIDAVAEALFHESHTGSGWDHQPDGLRQHYRDRARRLLGIADAVEKPPTQGLLNQFAEAIAAERVRAHEKHGKTSMEQAGLLEHRRASILTEEAVECARALNDHEHGTIELFGAEIPVDETGDELDKELIQTATMAYTWWANRRGDRLAPPPGSETPEVLTGQIAGFSPDGLGYVLPANVTFRKISDGIVMGTVLESASQGDRVRVRLTDAGLLYLLENDKI